MNFPKELKYTKNDEWVRVEGDEASVGISDYAQDQLSDIVFVEYLVDGGDTVAKGDACATVESVKAASEVYAPVYGEIVEANKALEDDPATVNTDAEGGGWFYKIKVANLSDLDGLMDEAAYKAFVAELD